jgi:hypothetical protein
MMIEISVPGERASGQPAAVRSRAERAMHGGPPLTPAVRADITPDELTDTCGLAAALGRDAGLAA